MSKFIPQAELTRCYRSGEELYFLIGKAQDMDSTIAMLIDEVPEESRYFDPVSAEWRINESHAKVLDQLFVNYPAILRGQSGANLPLVNSPHNQASRLPFAKSTRQGFSQTGQGRRLLSSQWFNILGYVAVALFCLAMWPWLAEGSNIPFSQIANSFLGQSTAEDEPETVAQPVVAATAISSSASSALASNTPEPISVTVIVTANLRAGPSTEFDVAGQLGSGETVNVTGQVVVPGSFSWYQLENGQWIYSQLVSGTDQVPPTLNEP